MNAYLAYTFFVGFFLMVSALPRRLGIIQLFLVFALLVVIWGGGVENGADWIWYLEDYLAINASESFLAASDKSLFEPGFVGLMYLTGALDLSFQWFLFLCSILNAGAWLYFSKTMAPKVNVAVSSLFIFLINGWVLYNEQLRQALAVSCLLVAYVFWCRGFLRLAFIGLLVAMFFHRSAIFFIVIFLLEAYVRSRPNSWRSYRTISIVIGSIAFLMFGLQSLIHSGILADYSENILIKKLIIYSEDENYGGSVFSMGMVTYLLTLFLALSTYRVVYDSKNHQTQFCWLICLVWSFVGPLLRTQSILIRIEHYLIPFVSLFLAYMWYARPRIFFNTFATRAIIIAILITFIGRVFFQPNQMVWVESYQNRVFSYLFFLPEVSTEERKLDICNNLRKNGSPFCDWR